MQGLSDLVQAGFQGFVVGGIALLAVVAFGKAFFDFNYRRPGE